MKSLQELYDEILASDELKQEFGEAVKSEETIAQFLKNHDCDASLEDLSAFLKEQLSKTQELDEQAMDQVAGGGVGTGIVVASSILLPIACALGAGVTGAVSAVHPDAKGVSDCFNLWKEVL